MNEDYIRKQRRGIIQLAGKGWYNLAIFLNDQLYRDLSRAWHKEPYIHKKEEIRRTLESLCRSELILQRRREQPKRKKSVSFETDPEISKIREMTKRGEAKTAFNLSEKKYLDLCREYHAAGSNSERAQIVQKMDSLIFLDTEINQIDI